MGRVTRRPNFALPVFVEPCEAPILFAPLKRCDLHGLTEDEARAKLKAFLEPASKPPPGPFPGGAKSPVAPAASAPSFPGGRLALSNVPIRVPEHFLGRGDALAAIETSLARAEGRVAITAVHGLRGVGKTTLAAAYAEKHRGDYRATWWIGAQTDSTMRADLVALGVRLGWVGAEDKEEPALEVVMERLRREGEGILLIFDNAFDADALKPYLPRGGAAKVLVTSNAHAWRGVAELVEIHTWPKETGADYLIARTGRETERAAAEALSEALGGLPLAHEQAAAYCERLDISLSEYRKRFEAAPARFLDDARHAPAEYHDGRTVAKTFALAIDEAAKLHPAAEPLIVHAALLAPEPILLFLFAEAREKFGEPLASALAGDGLDEAVAALRTFALLDRETIADEREPTIKTDCIRLHRLVREVASARCEGEARKDAQRALVGVPLALYPVDFFGDPKTWQRLRRLDVHSLMLVSGVPATPREAEEQAYLLNGLAEYRYGVLGDYAQARPLFERALVILEKTLGPEHPDTATGLNNFASLLQDQGDLAGARRLLERALTIREKALGLEHPHVGITLHSLAYVLKNQDDFAGARPLYERALEICGKTLGPEHHYMAAGLNNLATLLNAQGDLAAARPLCERALAIYEKALGPEHPDTATSLMNLGRLLQAQGEIAPARPLLERLLAVCEKTLGPEHPETNIARDHFAQLLLVSGNPGEALTLAEAALAAHEKLLGLDDPRTKHSAIVTADALDALGRVDEAAALRARIGLEDKAPRSRWWVRLARLARKNPWEGAAGAAAPIGSRRRRRRL
jgi:tetratricopeptide (TPR) repeat protein